MVDSRLPADGERIEGSGSSCDECESARVVRVEGDGIEDIRILYRPGPDFVEIHIVVCLRSTVESYGRSGRCGESDRRRPAVYCEPPGSRSKPSRKYKVERARTHIHHSFPCAL